MSRLTEKEREKVITNFLNHWKLSNDINPGWEIVPGYGLIQFEQQCDEYRMLVEKINDHMESELPLLRVGRDRLFGRHANDETGVWFWLSNYKGVVRAHLGKKHALSQTIPTIRSASPQRYGQILDSFLLHWNEVNQTPAGSMRLGPHTYNDLQAITTTLKQMIQKIHTIMELELPIWRVQRELMFGDVSDELRSDDSLINRMQIYQSRVITLWPNQPISVTLPRIFPAEAKSKIPEFEFNWVVGLDGKVEIWFPMPNSSKATYLFLQEGGYEKSTLLPTIPAGQMQHVIWEESFEVSGKLDLVELRDDAERRRMRGVFNPSIPYPSPATSTATDSGAEEK